MFIKMISVFITLINIFNVIRPLYSCIEKGLYGIVFDH